MKWRPSKDDHKLPASEQEQLKQVKKRLDRLEPRVNLIETELKLFRREA